MRGYMCRQVENRKAAVGGYLTLLQNFKVACTCVVVPFLRWYRCWTHTHQAIMIAAVVPVSGHILHSLRYSTIIIYVWYVNMVH